MMSVNARTSVVCDARWDNGGTPVSLGAIADVYWGHAYAALLAKIEHAYRRCNDPWEVVHVHKEMLGYLESQSAN